VKKNNPKKKKTKGVGPELRQDVLKREVDERKKLSFLRQTVCNRPQ